VLKGDRHPRGGKKGCGALGTFRGSAKGGCNQKQRITHRKQGIRGLRAQGYCIRRKTIRGRK